MVGVHGSHDSSPCYNPVLHGKRGSQPGKIRVTPITASDLSEQFHPGHQALNIRSRLSYRIRQFKQALLPPSGSVATAQVSSHLTPPQLALFRQLQPSEQWHAYTVMQRLKQSRHENRDLLTAALLHDIGKIFYPLNLWERVLIVLGRRFLPGRFKRWGQEPPVGFYKAFAVSARHAQWGADLADRAGASQLTVALIREHEESCTEKTSTRLGRYLQMLQQADDSS